MKLLLLLASQCLQLEVLLLLLLLTLAEPFSFLLLPLLL